MLLSEKLADIATRIPDDVCDKDELENADYSGLRTQLAVAISVAKKVEEESAALDLEIKRRSDRREVLTESYIRVKDMLLEQQLQRKQSEEARKQDVSKDKTVDEPEIDLDSVFSAFNK